MKRGHEWGELYKGYQVAAAASEGRYFGWDCEQKEMLVKVRIHSFPSIFRDLEIFN